MTTDTTPAVGQPQSVESAVSCHLSESCHRIPSGSWLTAFLINHLAVYRVRWRQLRCQLPHDFIETASSGYKLPFTSEDIQGHWGIFFLQNGGPASSWRRVGLKFGQISLPDCRLVPWIQIHHRGLGGTAATRWSLWGVDAGRQNFTVFNPTHKRQRSQRDL